MNTINSPEEIIEAEKDFALNNRTEVITRMMKKYAAQFKPNPKQKVFYLTKLEQKAYEKSGAKRIIFHEGSGIGTKVEIITKRGKVKDITDYASW